MAPVDGTYLFGATLLYKVNASTSARMSGRLVLNGTTEIRGLLRRSQRGRMSREATALWLQTMVSLTAGDTVELQGNFPRRGRLLRGCSDVLLGRQRSAEGGAPWPHNARRRALSAWPEHEFEAILARAAEEGAKRALADVGLEGDEAALDIRDLRSMLDLLRLVRRTAVQTVVRAVTTAILLALLAGVAIKLKVFGNGP